MKWHLLLDYDDDDAVPGHDSTKVPDSGRAHEIIRKRLARAGYTVVGWSFEESTNGWHAKVSLDPTPGAPMERVALQAICGSDPLREACNVSRARAAEQLDDPYWSERWNVLYVPNPNRRRIHDAR